MYMNNINILLRVITMPFASMKFYRKKNGKDFIENLSVKQNYKDYIREYSKDDGLVKSILSELINKQLVLNFDNIDLLVKKYYGHQAVKDKNIIDIYLDILSKLAQSFICHRNGRIALKYWENINDRNFIGPYEGLDKIVLWNSLNRIIDTNIIVFKYLLDNDMRDEEYLYGYYSSITLEDIQLEDILEKGVAETHIHRGAAITFLISWRQLMNNVSSKVYNNIKLEDNIFENLHIENYLKAIMICRIVMGFYIKNYSDISNKFGEYIKKSFYKNKFKDCNNDYENYRRNNIKHKNEDEMIFEIIEKVSVGEEIDSSFIEYCKISSLYNYLKEKYNLKIDIDTAETEGYSSDIMDLIFEEYEGIRTNSENIFLFKSFKYIENKKDYYFSQLLFQYLRIKNYVFQKKIQNDSKRDLIIFKKFTGDLRNMKISIL